MSTLMSRSLVPAQRKNVLKFLLSAFLYSLDFHYPFKLTNISASPLFGKKIHNSLGKNLAFQTVLKPLLLSLGRGGMIPKFVILHTVLGAFL